jgi:8-oxo-dGTP diphosphatase
MTVVLLRHASAGDRDRWEGDDRLRPLDKLSSPYVRCTQTVAPLGLAVEPDERLAEGADPDDTRALLLQADGAVACTHGDVIENIVGLSIKKGAAVVLDGLDVVERIDAP